MAADSAEPRVRTGVLILRRTPRKKAIDRSPVSPSPPEAGAFAFSVGQWPRRDTSMSYGRSNRGPANEAHRYVYEVVPTGDSANGRVRIQWPRERVRLARRPAGGDLRLGGRTGSGKKVPSGNSKYRLNTCTCPSPPRLPSITNFVPTGNRLGRRPELCAMTSSCKALSPCHCNV